MIDPMTLEDKIREQYGINIEIFYHEVKYSRRSIQKKYKGTYKNKLDYARNYITRIRKMYPEQADEEFKHMNSRNLIHDIAELDKKKDECIITEREKDLKERMHRTLIAKRLLKEAIRFVGVEPFERFIGRPISKRNKKEHTRNEEERHKDIKTDGKPSGGILSNSEEAITKIDKTEGHERESGSVQGGYVLAR